MSEEFPRDAIIDHLANTYALEHVIDFGEEPVPAQWIAVYTRAACVVSVALQRERYRGFDMFMLTFARGRQQLGTTYLCTRHVPDFIAVINSRFQK